jgi:ApbE superfamily uncharacterized protein (UPF0280 family)
MFQQRHYRQIVAGDHLVSFQVTVKETDVWIRARTRLEARARERIFACRGHLEAYIQAYPDFRDTLVPWLVAGPMPKIVGDMAAAGNAAGVGPMAAVAGAIAEQVGVDILTVSDEVIVENGGDIFVRLNRPFVSAIYAADSPLSMRVGVRIDPADRPIAICTSSGTIGHSLSMGKADAVCVVSRSCPLADAAATAIGNRVGSAGAVASAIAFGKSIPGVIGIVIIVNDKIGAWGDGSVMSLTDRPGR